MNIYVSSISIYEGAKGLKLNWIEKIIQIAYPLKYSVHLRGVTFMDFDTFSQSSATWDLEQRKGVEEDILAKNQIPIFIIDGNNHLVAYASVIEKSKEDAKVDRLKSRNGHVI